MGHFWGWRVRGSLEEGRGVMNFAAVTMLGIRVSVPAWLLLPVFWERRCPESVPSDCMMQTFSRTQVWGFSSRSHVMHRGGEMLDACVW